MAALYASLYTQATTHAGLGALIGTRIYPGPLPQGATLPAVTYSEVGTSGTAGSTGSYQGRFQFNAWGNTYIQARQVADQVEAAFRSVAVGGDTRLIGGKRISRFDDYEASTARYRTIVDMRINIVETGGQF